MSLFPESEMTEWLGIAQHELISKWGHIQRHWRLEHQYLNSSPYCRSQIHPLCPSMKLILRQILSEIENNSFIAIVMLSYSVSESGRIKKSFIVMVQRRQGHLLDSLLIGWWYANKWESTSSTFWFQVVWGLHVCGKHTVSFSHLVGFSDLQNSSKILLCISLERGSGHCPKAVLFCVCVSGSGGRAGAGYFGCSSLCLYITSLLSLATVEHTHWNSGSQGYWMKTISCN